MGGFGQDPTRNSGLRKVYWYYSSRQDKYVPIRHQGGGEGCRFPTDNIGSITFVKSLQRFVDIMECSDDDMQGTTTDEDSLSDDDTEY